jgi:site-specific DNA-adenine methylase
VKVAAQNSRLATIYANRTRFEGAYRLNSRLGTFTMLGGFAANSSKLDPSMLAAVTQPLAAAGGTPIGPVATSIGKA